MPSAIQMPLAAPRSTGAGSDAGGNVVVDDQSPVQVPTRYGTILIDIRPIRAYAKRIVTLFVQAGAVLEVNLGHTDRTAVGTRLMRALGLKTSLPIKTQRAYVTSTARASAVAPALRGLAATARSETSSRMASKLDEIASVFDPALLEMVRSTALNVYGPFIESEQAKVLAILEPSHQTSRPSSLTQL